MVTRMTIEEAQADFDNVVQRAVDGEVIYLVDETGRDTATLVPIQTAPPHQTLQP